MATQRSTIPFTNEHFVEFLKALQAKGSPYWYGTCVYKCTESLRSRKAKQYPSHYGSDRTAKYRRNIAAKEICADCVGVIKGYMWTNGGKGVLEAYGTDKEIESKYGSNNCPDKSANGMFTYAKSKGVEWGPIASIPEIPGIAVRYDGHVGVYIGDGKVVEWRGFSYGSRITKLSGRKWLHWYKLPFINYDAAANTEPGEVTLGERTLKLTDPLMKGGDVKMLQELLMKIGYELPKYGADGEYGGETAAAVVRFQAAQKLDADSEYGPDTHRALMDAVADLEAGDGDNEEGEEPQQPEVKMVEIVSSGGRVNIRSGNDTRYERISAVKPGTMYEYVATAVNGWHALVIGDKIGWVSGAYGRVKG